MSAFGKHRGHVPCGCTGSVFLSRFIETGIHREVFIVSSPVRFGGAAIEVWRGPAKRTRYESRSIPRTRSKSASKEAILWVPSSCITTRETASANDRLPS